MISFDVFSIKANNNYTTWLKIVQPYFYIYYRTKENITFLFAILIPWILTMSKSSNCFQTPCNSFAIFVTYEKVGSIYSHRVLINNLPSNSPQSYTLKNLYLCINVQNLYIFPKWRLKWIELLRRIFLPTSQHP